MKELKIEAPDGYEVDKEASTFEKIVFKKKKGLPKRWEDLRGVDGYYVDGYSEIGKIENFTTKFSYDKNVFSTKEEAEAALALSQLSQLKKAYNGDWKPDWTDGKQKYCITFMNTIIVFRSALGDSYFLAFKTEELRYEFLENFRDLIETAKPLL